MWEYPLEHQTVHGFYLAYIEDYLQSLGLDSAPLFRTLGIDPTGADRHARVDVESFAQAMLGAARISGRPGFFLELGARIPILAHGNLGAALMACRDVGMVFSLIERYSAIVLAFVRISVHDLGREVAVEYQTTSPRPDMNIAIMEAFIGTTGYNLSLLTDQPIKPLRAELSHKAPAHAALYEDVAGCTVRFDAGVNRLTFSRSQFDIPLKTANALNQRFMVQECEAELRKVQSHARLADRIREILSLYLEQSPSISFVADRLHTSERTLRRHLDEEGVNFRDLLKKIRHETACYYLGNTHMRIEQIAQKLGYAETANFRKAFKEDTGLSPRQWRDAKASNHVTPGVDTPMGDA